MGHEKSIQSLREWNHYSHFAWKEDGKKEKEERKGMHKGLCVLVFKEQINEERSWFHLLLHWMLSKKHWRICWIYNHVPHFQASAGEKAVNKSVLGDKLGRAMAAGGAAAFGTQKFGFPFLPPRAKWSCLSKRDTFFSPQNTSHLTGFPSSLFSSSCFLLVRESFFSMNTLRSPHFPPQLPPMRVFFSSLPATSYLLLLPLCISSAHRRMERKWYLVNLSATLYVWAWGVSHPNSLCWFPSPNPNSGFISDHLDLDCLYSLFCPYASAFLAEPLLVLVDGLLGFALCWFDTAGIHLGIHLGICFFSKETRAGIKDYQFGLMLILD